MKKKTNWIVIYLTIFIAGFLLLGPFMFSNKQILCAKFSKISKIKNSKILVYKFKLDGFYHEGNMSINTLSDREIKVLKNKKCIQIEVSNYWSFFNRYVEVK
ncbi:MAG: hypothetical protein ACK5B9_07960 [Flavobacteriia bacterium]|jgi:hypothetical protein